MSSILKLAAAGFAFVTLVVWLFGGPNLGMTRFGNPQSGGAEPNVVLGIDFLGAGLFVAGSLFLVGRIKQWKNRPAPGNPSSGPANREN